MLTEGAIAHQPFSSHLQRTDHQTATFLHTCHQPIFLYRLSGVLQGTAATEEEELYEVYGLSCVSIPTCRPRVRVDHPPIMYMLRGEADNHLCWTVLQAVQQRQPVLIGTSSVEESNAVLSSLKSW